MAKSSILGGLPAEQVPEGRDNDLLGPSDSSDSGSDVQSLHLESDSDSAGTGERASVEPGPNPTGSDILPDRVTTSDDALDRADASLDEAEQLTDEEGEEADEDDGIPGAQPT